MGFHTLVPNLLNRKVQRAPWNNPISAQLVLKGIAKWNAGLQTFDHTLIVHLGCPQQLVRTIWAS